MNRSEPDGRLGALRLKSMAETTSLYSEPVWRLIWDEILPTPLPDEPYVFDKHGTLIALWYISVELNQGFYPNWEKLLHTLAVAPGVGTSFSKAATLPTVREILDEIVNGSRAGKLTPAVANFGWLKAKRSGKSRFVLPANATAMNNIIAIMDTALDVGKWIRSEEFLRDIEHRLMHDSPDEKEFLDRCDQVLNDFDYKTGRIMKIANRIRRNLQRFGFDGTPEGDMKVTHCKALDERPRNPRAVDWPVPPLWEFPTVTCDQEYIELLLDR